MQAQSRRVFIGGLLSGAFAPALVRPAAAAIPPGLAAHYGAVEGEPFPIPAAPLSRIDPAYLRAEVSYDGDGEPGSIVVDPGTRHLYLIQGDGRAIRYGVGVGREGFGWSGDATIHDKREWPDWYPPKEMIARQPEIRRQMSDLQGGLGMPGGPRNPLGARAMYLFQGNKDTLYRIHGTVEPWTIGKRVSSGCIRMINQDAIDLYNRVQVGTRVVVLGGGEDVVASRRPRDEQPAQRPMRIRPDTPQPGQGGYDPYQGRDPYQGYNPYQGSNPSQGYNPYQRGYDPYAYRSRPNGYDPYRGYYGGGTPYRQPYNQPWMDGDM